MHEISRRMDDDIDVLPNGEHEFSEDPTFNPRADNLPNMHVSFTKDEKDGSLHALQTAYGDLKKRYRDQESRINMLQTSIREMETQRISNMRPNSGVYGAAGPSSASGISPAAEEYQIKAEFGFAQSLERQLMRAKSTIRSLESDRKEIVKKLESFQKEFKIMQLLNQEKEKKIELLKFDPETSSSEVTQLKQHVQKLTVQLREKENQVMILQEKCKNLERRLSGQDCSITENRPTGQDRSVTLEEQQILQQIEKYNYTINELKAKVNEQTRLLQNQQNLVKKILEEKSSLNSPISRYADGASYYPPHTEIGEGAGHTPQASLYVKGSPSLGIQQKQDQGQGHRNNNYPTLMTLTDKVNDLTVHSRTNKVPQMSTWTSALSTQPSDTIDQTLANKQEFRKRNSGGILGPQENVHISDTSDGSENNSPVGRSNYSRKTLPMTQISQEPSYYENLALPVSKETTMQSAKSSHRTNVEKVPIDTARQTSNTTGLNYPHRPTSTESAREIEDYVNIGDIPSGQRLQPLGLSKKVVTLGQEDTFMEARPTAPEEARTYTSGQICPVCNQQFPNMSLEDFQVHVLNCMDNENEDDDDQYGTLQNSPPVANCPSPENKICPMCGASFPAELPQSEFERHVMEHFGEDPILERFEVLHP